MKKILVIVGIIGSVLVGCKPTVVGEVTEKSCIVTEVEFFQIGQRHTLQIDPEWKVKTDCGNRFTIHRPIRVGDTIQIKIVKYKKK